MNATPTLKQALTAGLTAALVATAGNAILYYAFHAAGVLVDTLYIKDQQPLTIVPVVISSIVPSMLASLVFFLLTKYTAKGFAIFRIISLVLLIVSFINPFVAIKGVTLGYALVLNLMHVVVVASLLYYLGKSLRGKGAA